MRWLNQSWKFVSAERFGAMVSGAEPIQGRNLLLTFDDGFASNRVVAEEVLNPMRIPALFFVVSELVAMTDRDDARHFIAHHIQPGTNAARLPEHLFNMGWSDLEALLEQHHVVGSHTRRHARLSELHSDVDLNDDIVGAADTLERRLGISIQHFAYPFGDVASFSERALTVARRRFAFLYSGLRGDNSDGVAATAIRRDAATPQDSLALLGAYLNGAADFAYARSRATLDGWS